MRLFICLLAVLAGNVKSLVPLNTPRLEEYLTPIPPKIRLNDPAVIDILLDQNGDQQIIYNNAFATFKRINPTVKQVLLNGGFFYRFPGYGEKVITEEFQRTINGLRAVVSAAKANGLTIIDFNVRFQWLMYYTISHDTYNFKQLLQTFFRTEVKTDDYADFRTTLLFDNVPVRIHAEFQFDPRRNRHQPEGRVPENPRRNEVIADRSTTGKGKVFWVEDMAYVTAKRATMNELPFDFIFFSPIQDFAEEPEVFYSQAVKKLNTLFSEIRPVRLYGSAVVKGKRNTKEEFVSSWNLIKRNIDAVLDSFYKQHYPITQVTVMVWFDFPEAITSNWREILQASYNISPGSVNFSRNFAQFAYINGKLPVKMDIHIGLTPDVASVMDNTKTRQSVLYKIE